MATATTVAINVVVDGVQAVEGVDQINAKLATMGQAAGSSAGAAAAGLGKMEGQLATNREGVRLLSEEFGLRMPRALTNVISKIGGVGEAVQGMMTAFVGFAMLEVGVRLAGDLAKAFDVGGGAARELQKNIEANDLAMRRLQDSTALQTLKIEEETAKIEKKPFQNGVALALAEASERADQLSSQLDAINSKFAENISKMGGTTTQTVLHGELFTGRAGEMVQEHQFNLEQQSSKEGMLGEEGRYAKALQDRLDALKQLVPLSRELHGFLNFDTAIQQVEVAQARQKREAAEIQSSIGSDAAQARLDKDNANKQDSVGTKSGRDASKEAAKEAARQQQEVTNEITRLQHAALESQMSDEARQNQKRLDEIDTETQHLIEQHATKAQLAAATDAINKKYFDDEFARQEKLLQQSSLGAERAQVEAMSPGADRVKAEYKLRMDTAAANKDLTPGDLLAEQVAAKQEENQKLAALDKQAADMQARIGDQETAYAARASEAERRVRAQGLEGWVGDYRAAVDSINAERLNQEQNLQKVAADEKMTWEQVGQAHMNINRAANAQIEAANLELRNQIAGTLAEAFSNPVDFIKRRMEEMMFQIVAAWIMHLKIFQGVFRQTLGGMTPGGGAGGFMGMLTPHAAAGAPGGVGMPTGSAGAGSTPAAGSGPSGVGMASVGAPSASGSPGVASVSSIASMASDAPGMMQTIGAARSSIAAQHAATAPLPFGATSSGAFDGGSGGTLGAGSDTTGVGLAAAATGPLSSAAVNASGLVSSIGGTSSSIAAQHAASSPLPVGAASSAAFDGGAGGMIGGGSNYTGIGLASAGTVSAGSPAAEGSTSSVLGAAASGAPGLIQSIGGARSALAAQDVSSSPLPVGAAASSSIPGSSIHFDANGNATTDALIPQRPMQQPHVGTITNLGSAVTVGTAGYGAYKSTRADFFSATAGGTMKGMLADAGYGAAIGSLFGPMGTLIGAGVGAAVGAIAGITGAIMGEGGKLAARRYYEHTLFPAIEKQRNGMGATDFQQAISSVNRTAADGLDYMREHWGGVAAQWVNDNYLKKEQQLADSEIASRAKGGSFAVGMSAKQFHSGGEITGFGSLGTGGSEGLIHALMGEMVMNPSAASTHGSVLHAMNAGASPTDVASMYLAAAGRGPSAMTSASAPVTHHWNVQALDSKSFDQFLQNGNARTVVKHVNSFVGQYAGDGISG